MSMWEIEALSEEAVRLVDEASLPTKRKRNLILSIYKSTSEWDVSFTHFRNTDALVRNSCFFNLKVERHPEYEVRKSEFEDFVAGKSSWLRDPTSNQVEAIYSGIDKNIAKQFWFDPSMALWDKAVKAGLLKDLAAEDPAYIEKPELMSALMELSSVLEVEYWAVAFMKLFHGFMAYNPDEIDPQNIHLQKALKLPRVAERLNTEVTGPQDWIEERFNARDALKYAEGENKRKLDWWCSPYNAK